MKKSTSVNKLAALLGISQEVVEKASVHVQQDPEFKKKKKSSNNGPVGISEEEIQSFRAAQGLVYFLQAPELFSPKVCAHCGEHYLVSRQFVAFCSYTCIDKDLEAKGIKWSKRNDYDFIGNEVYEGNEPIWIRNLDRIREVLLADRFTESLLSQASHASQEKLSSSMTEPSVPQLTT